MIVSDNVLNRIVKNKLSKKRGVHTMNNYALFDNENVLLENFEKDIQFSDISSIQDEINNVCDPDKIFSISEFENKKKEMLEKQKADFSKKLEKNDNLEQVVLVLEEFVPIEIINENKIILSDLKKQIKSLKFKIFYYEVQKRQEILDNNISSAVKTSDEIAFLNKKLDEFIHKYFGIVENLNKIQIENCNKYLCMLNDFCREKNIPNKLSTLVNKYSEFVVHRFLVDKIVYLILSSLGMISKEKIIQSLETDEFLKTNYSSLYDDILERIRNVGTDCKSSNK